MVFRAERNIGMAKVQQKYQASSEVLMELRHSALSEAIFLLQERTYFLLLM